MGNGGICADVKKVFTFVPGSVNNSAVGSPARVLPAIACSAFSEVREYSGRLHEYADGRGQAAAEVTNSRKAFEASVVANGAAMAALEQFHTENMSRAFYFYLFAEGPHDPSGVATLGRYKVRFEGPFEAERGMSKNEARIRLVEVA